MSSATPLPKTLDLRRAAAKGRIYEGDVALTELPRVAAAVLPQHAVLHVTLACSRDEQRRFLVQATIVGSLQVQCQRCLAPVSIAVQARQWLAVVADDEAARQLPKQMEALLAPEQDNDLWALVEDEVLLALPAVARHAHDCLPVLRDYAPEPLETAPAERKPNPFTILADLKSVPKPSQE